MLVDDHAVVRMGFRLLLESDPGVQVVAEADSGEAALRLYPEVRPDVVVMDVSMPGMGGIEAVSRLVAKDPGAKVLVLSAHEDTVHPKRLLKAGALGYLSKRTAADELLRALRQVADGRNYIDPVLAQQLAVQQFSGDRNPVEVLSEREFEVFMQLARGQSVNRIAETLFLSPRTVGTHLYNIKQKLAAENAAELTLIAMRNGLLAP
ncbi:MAG: response regulator transcription factor [Pseudomonadota bacterium]|nr:response regulator transcription factor [Pseudomonadota bacterium]